ncbi:histidine phosphatase family protein [Robbsia sp. KACC 23696]|uniref:histidine phosphatase family protein n=1 Tax=Robbsia sp. KACC 23696 TaxID=3149231 RepID=UPI00325AF87F
MARAIVMMAHASTPAMRKGLFPERDETAALRGQRHAAAFDTESEGLDARAVEELRAARESEAFVALTSAFVRVYCAPSAIAVASATALGFSSEQITIDGTLSTPHFGAWAGKSALQIGRDDPAALQAWTRDPYFAPPGGDSFDSVRRRMTVWLASTMKDDADTVENGDDALPILAIASATVVRAAVLLARRARLESFHQLDVAPGAMFVL